MKSNLQSGCTVQPQTKEELVDIIKDTCKKKGWNCDLNFIDTSKITDMSRLFANIPTCYGGYGFRKFNCDISKWNVSNVKNMDSMFSGAKKFNQPLNDWNTSNVESMNYMFFDAISFNQPIENWVVSKVTTMHYMFGYAKNFNQPLDKWNVSKVKSMKGMFAHAKNFNQPIENGMFPM